MTDPSDPKERSYRRVAIDPFVRVSAEGKSFVLRTRDLSRSGLFLYTQVARLYPFRAGSELELELFDFDCAIKFRVVVVRMVEERTPEAERYPSGFACRIVEIDAENRKLLDDLLERAARGDVLY